jgi:hypothetical protein
MVIAHVPFIQPFFATTTYAAVPNFGTLKRYKGCQLSMDYFYFQEDREICQAVVKVIAQIKAG